MLPKAIVLGALVVAIAVSASAAAPQSGRAATKRETVAFVTTNTGTPRIQAIARGARLAAKALGVHFILGGPKSGMDVLPAWQSLIARHVGVIATEGYAPEMKPIYTKVRAAGIKLIGAGDDIAGARSVWVNMSSPSAYAQAIADALARQVQRTGDYTIVEQQDEYPIADEWARLAKAYIAKTYPAMKLVGIVRGTGAGDAAEEASVQSYVVAHPRLKGLLAVTPTESYMVAEAITRSHNVGKIFSADNGGGDFLDPFPAWVRSGAAEFVYGGDQVKLGYATVWAAHWLLSGHTFKPGAYQVGGELGLVWYYPKHQELRLGPPLTITKENVDVYAGKF
jgi:ABC-type sugar transport system substrate-binding protein